jgi:Inositol phospholipid synthesis and fat-storage-inducing TM
MALQQPSSISPFLPTLLEAALLLLYPTTLILGSLFSQLAPHIAYSTSQYSVQHQSYQPSHLAPSYFAQKKNIFNLYFVKVGWFWVTLSMALLLLTHPYFGRPLDVLSHPLGRNMRRAKAALRWLCATLVWAAVTQWFFGPPLIDRSFRLTGGMCEVLDDPEKTARMSTEREVLTHAACKAVRGQWKGGHDISGHVFLLILGSAMLWMEMLPVVLHARGLREERRIAMSDGRTVTAAVEAEGKPATEKEKENNLVTSLGVKLAVGIVALSWWMLLMTAAFFHTWVEKFTGLLVAFAGLWLVYFLPRGVPAVRNVLGMPGL